MEQGKIQTLYDFETKEAVAPRTVLEAITGTGTEGQVVGFTEDNVIGVINPPQTGITEEDADNRYLQLSGGTMTGALSVQEPTEDVNAVNKGYVDDALQRKSNPNLLDNWYFANPINQRGQLKYSSEKNYHGIDRWKCLANSTLEIVPGGVKLSPAAWMQEIIELPITSILGMPITLSLLHNEGLDTVTYIVKDGVQDYITAFGGKLRLQSISGNTTFTIFQGPGDTTFKAAKLEFGSVQTLAHKEGSIWVLNDPPPDPALELAKCQRYQQVLNGSKSNWVYYPCVIRSATLIELMNVPIAPLRARPTASTIDVTSMLLTKAGGVGPVLRTNPTQFAVGYSIGDHKMSYISITVPEHSLAAGDRYYAFFNGTNEMGNGSLLLDANL